MTADRLLELAAAGHLYATTCTVCGDELGAGEAHVGSIDKGTGRINWICGTARWDRP